MTLILPEVILSPCTCIFTNFSVPKSCDNLWKLLCEAIKFLYYTLLGVTYSSQLIHCAIYDNCYRKLHEIFIVKIFSDSMGNAKIKHMKIMRIINTNAVWGHLSENYLTQKYISTKCFDTKYLHDLRYIIRYTILDIYNINTLKNSL